MQCRVRTSTMALRFRNLLSKLSPCKSCRCMCSNSGKKDGESDKYIPDPSLPGEYRDPWQMLKQELLNVVRPPEKKVDLLPVPRETDIAIIGGAAVGSSVAYWLKQRNPRGFGLTVIEKDPTYIRSATTLSVGGIRQQFSLPENIKMSQFSAQFLQEIKEHLSIYDAEPPEICFNPHGYLFLASDNGADTLAANHKIQKYSNTVNFLLLISQALYFRELGANVDLMTPEKIKAKWPWMNVDDVALGTYGVENEGSFDPWLLLSAFRKKATSLGTNYIKGEVVGFRFDDRRMMGVHGKVFTRKQLSHVEIRAENGQVYPMKFAAIINCAGPWSGEIARMAGIGIGEESLQIPLPVEPRKRYVYVIHCPAGPGLDTPMIIDHTGVYLRREGIGGNFICGRSPDEDGEPDTSTLEVDYEYFNEHVWPSLANRVPCLEAVKGDTECNHDHMGVEPQYFQRRVAPDLIHRAPVFKSAEIRSAWAGFYDYNYYDQNLIIGNHPYFRNFFMATGCSGHGIQQSPAIGRAMMELLIDDEYKTIDLSRFGFDRILEGEQVLETNIV